MDHYRPKAPGGLGITDQPRPYRGLLCMLVAPDLALANPWFPLSYLHRARHDASVKISERLGTVQLLYGPQRVAAKLCFVAHRRVQAKCILPHELDHLHCMLC